MERIDRKTVVMKLGKYKYANKSRDNKTIPKHEDNDETNNDN